MKQISRYLLTLVALFAMTAGAWAQEETLLTTIESTGDNASFTKDSKTFDDKATVTFSTTVVNTNNNWGWFTSGKATLTVTPAEGYAITRVNFYSNEGSAFDETAPFEATTQFLINDGYYTFVNGTNIGHWGVKKIEVYGYAGTPAPAGLEITCNEASTVASFDMPADDVTIDYELVRDMEVDINAVMADRIRIKKSGSTYTPIDLLSVIPTVTDKLDAQNPVEMEWGTDYEMTLEKKGENNEWVATTDYSVGTFRAVIHGLNLYDGITYTNEFRLFEGYEVEVAAGEYVTYYKEENLYVEDADAELYTITSVGSETATAAPLTVSKAYTPILVKNKGAEKKVILLIPTATEGDDVDAAPEFIGTLEATTIAASSENQNNYAFNGLQFVWVKNAIEIGANKAWLSVNTGVPSARIMIVFEDETTGIGLTPALSKGEGVIYDLSGRKIAKPVKKGVYVINGKKVVVK